MKKYISLFSVLVMFGCIKKAIILNTYTLDIQQNVLNVTGSKFIEEFKTDTIMGKNDTLAYNRAILRFLALRKAEELTKNRVSISKDFKIYDPSGLDLSFKLDKNVLDSIENVWHNINSKYKALLKR